LGHLERGEQKHSGKRETEIERRIGKGKEGRKE
jgi:hypothetical protein